MSNSSLSNLPPGPSSRPPSSPPTQHAPLPPPSQHAPPPPPHGVHSRQQRSHVRSPVTNVTTPPPATPDDELLAQLPREELVGRIKTLEAMNRKLLYDNGSMMKDINHNLVQVQHLKQQVFQLNADNNELRDLCCYLDDERSRARAMAREWQSFGTHMSRVMRHEITTYSNKLSQLETKQFELVRENFELKQLCLLLDNAIATRENGDGSTGSGGSAVEDPSHSQTHDNNNNTESAQRAQQHRVILSHQILEYIRSLENRVQQLEWDKKQISDLNSNPDTVDSFENNSVATSSEPNGSGGCPTAIAEAMRVLRIQDSLNAEASSNNKERKGSGNGSSAGTSSDADDMALAHQKAIVGSFCNVVWRKIEDGS